jgi:hypothetical protein
VKLDELLPDYDVVERHARDVAASPDRVFAALRTLDFADSPIIRMLWRLRSLGREREMTWDALERFGFVVVANDPPRELVLGLLAQPWRFDGGIQHPTADEWRSFDRTAPPFGGAAGQAQVPAGGRTGFAKIAWSFSTVELATGGTTLVTETRVRCTDDASRRKFRWYWRAIGPFSALIRRETLRLVERASV